MKKAYCVCLLMRTPFWLCYNQNLVILRTIFSYSLLFFLISTTQRVQPCGLPAWKAGRRHCTSCFSVTPLSLDETSTLPALLHWDKMLTLLTSGARVPAWLVARNELVASFLFRSETYTCICNLILILQIPSKIEFVKASTVTLSEQDFKRWVLLETSLNRNLYTKHTTQMRNTDTKHCNLGCGHMMPQLVHTRKRPEWWCTDFSTSCVITPGDARHFDKFSTKTVPNGLRYGLKIKQKHPRSVTCTPNMNIWTQGVALSSF